MTINLPLVIVNRDLMYFNIKPQSMREQYHNIPQLIAKIESRISQSTSLIQSIPSKHRLELEYFVSSISSCLSLLKEQSIFLARANQELEHQRQTNAQKITSLEQRYLSLKVQSGKDLLQLQNKNHKLVKQVEFLNFVVKGLKEEVNQSKLMISSVKKAGINHVNTLIRDMEKSVRKSAEKICDRISAYRQESNIFTVHTEQEETVHKSKKKREPKPERERQKEMPERAERIFAQEGLQEQMTELKKSKKMETKLARILQEQARRAEVQQRQCYIQTNQN